MGNTRRIPPASLSYLVEIVSSDGEVVKSMGPMGKHAAEKVEDGASINLNHEKYYIRIVPA